MGAPCPRGHSPGVGCWAPTRPGGDATGLLDAWQEPRRAQGNQAGCAGQARAPGRVGGTSVAEAFTESRARQRPQSAVLRLALWAAQVQCPLRVRTARAHWGPWPRGRWTPPGPPCTCHPFGSPGSLSCRSPFSCILLAVAQPLEHTRRESHPGRTGPLPPSTQPRAEVSPVPWPCKTLTEEPRVRVMKDSGPRWLCSRGPNCHPFGGEGHRRPWHEHSPSVLGPQAAHLLREPRRLPTPARLDHPDAKPCLLQDCDPRLAGSGGISVLNAGCGSSQAGAPREAGWLRGGVCRQAQCRWGLYHSRQPARSPG